MRLRLPDPPHNRPRWNPPLKTRFNIASFGLHYLSGSLRLSTATRYRLIVDLHDLRERPPASGCPGRASPAEERVLEDPRRPGGLPDHTYFSFPAAKRTDFSSASRAEWRDGEVATATEASTAGRE